MNYRYMRVIVFFYLPTETVEDKKEYMNLAKLQLNTLGKRLNNLIKKTL